MGLEFCTLFTDSDDKCSFGSDLVTLTVVPRRYRRGHTFDDMPQVAVLLATEESLIDTGRISRYDLQKEVRGLTYLWDRTESGPSLPCKSIVLFVCWCLGENLSPCLFLMGKQTRIPARNGRGSRYSILATSQRLGPTVLRVLQYPGSYSTRPYSYTVFLCTFLERSSSSCASRSSPL